MTSGAGASYDYNSQGLRRTKTINGETDYFVLVGGNVWSDGDADYFRGIELISNGSQLYLYNIRGDVIQLTDLSGNVTKTYDYDAYGNELQRDLNDENPFRYCGEYYDTETGFIYLRARYYDPMVGRFTSIDPIKDGLNWYVYCADNPVLYADKNGLAFDLIFDLVSLGFSVYDVIKNPDDFWAWAGLVGDLVDIAIPLASGIGELTKAAGATSDAFKMIKKAAKRFADVVDYSPAGVWLKGICDRGYEIEKILGGMCNNFPKIDKFIETIAENGKHMLSSITSIKSMDITLDSYRNGNKMLTMMKKYIDDVASFARTTYKRTEYIVEEGAQRFLELAIPPVNMSKEQYKMLEQALEYAKEKGVEVIMHFIE